MADSPQLLAKKAQRDEKRKKLRDMMESAFHTNTTSQSGESSSEKQYSSYQHADVEEGHIVLINEERPPQLLKEQIASLIHNEADGEETENGVRVSRKQEAAGAAVLFVLLCWWLA